MEPTMFSPNATWLLKLQDRPLEALDECRTAFQAGEVSRNERLYATIASLILFVDALADSPADERAFRAHPFWNGSRRVLKSRRLSLLAVRYVLGAARAEGALYEQARSYAQAVEHFRDGAFDTAAVIARLQRHGIYGLLDQLAGDGGESDTASSDDGDDAAHAAETGSDGGEGSGDSSSADSSDDEGEAGDDAASNDAPSDVWSRAWWAAFLARAKEIHASGRVPIIIAGDWSNLEDLERRSQTRPAIVTVSQGEPVDGWATFACERVERTRPATGDRIVPARPRRLFPALPPTGGEAGPAVEPGALQPRM